MTDQEYIKALEARIELLTDFLYEQYGNSMPYDICREQQEKRRLANEAKEQRRQEKAAGAEYHKAEYYKKMGWTK